MRADRQVIKCGVVKAIKTERAALCHNAELRAWHLDPWHRSLGGETARSTESHQLHGLGAHCVLHFPTCTGALHRSEPPQSFRTRICLDHRGICDVGHAAHAALPPSSRSESHYACCSFLVCSLLKQSIVSSHSMPRPRIQQKPHMGALGSATGVSGLVRYTRTMTALTDGSRWSPILARL